ncbi:venom allergen 5-like [Chelonus insularis]|uniref:venom allergen 5-like n=1 Tax=Chelonus insularis TaxID=460826 RepID=UPI00158C3C9C|nr:venom allergen 5-like [Chelonus insularis]
MAKMSQFSFVSFALIVFATWVNADNCYPDSCNGQMHTMCLYRSPQPAPTCNEVQSAKLTPAEEREILDAHNKLRALVAAGRETRGISGPQPAGNIPSLKWDPELAKIAQRWANQCSFGHDKCRNIPKYNVGQNVATRSRTDGHRAKLSELVQDWYEEVKDFSNRSVPKFQWQSWPQIGHYTQLVWGKTTSVGCGAIRYKDSEGWYTTYLVCNYGPSGNWIGEPIYQTRY